MKTEKYARPGFHPSSSPEVTAGRSKRGGTRTRHCTHPNRTQRQEDALARQAEYDKLSTQEKYDRAVQRGHAESREALRLAAQLAD